ncbi:MAG: electron transfer flavoprotein-ubiquinone oxidoreductase [Rhodospirillaceae bacterium]|jgi:electron-transferring-flavoprotein dehydrogenase|nr:electron transfer flavoprotein-ubiquinone oxidoreductase [Rhodospirillaceae bacterium]MBT3932558.1 electron transfer flavoprotein-ubiquinone oxidoreductase [Rhodospirillaceae bacterium]MBT4772938.1 electron transfer flavoprotein-ubiquinone oxidoreductase [Rhodospirillaceae bacterium]MBT5358304.1 electron transfer flavoprotein-ubiquinone oxidoreductase [Rhodospirillaceae bacterium]MBT5767923.1 electron transfer flavoprotein-ubiquinone oxidoreductase [Rhodospirillaceae bacterium]
MSEEATERESMAYDVVIVGAGPSGLAAAIRLKQRAAEADAEIGVCVLEKGSEVGAHILSGAVLETRALDELLPDWREMDAPIKTPVSDEKFLFLRETGATSIPTSLLPPTLKNHGNHIISLGNLARWLGEQAEALGVEIYPGFAATEVLFDEEGAVRGVATGDMGVGVDGAPTANYTQGIELHARYTFFAEGCRGHLGLQLMDRFDLRANVEAQTYGIGIKELWEVDPDQHQAGLVVHTAGWPMDAKTYGGSFLYHLEDNQVAVGFVIGLDYKNPYLSPFDEFQRFKTHPSVRPTFEGGKRISYGARALNEGGVQSLPEMVFPGGALIGCEAGTLNVPKIKGTHTAMKSGMLAADAAFAALTGDAAPGPVLDGFTAAFKASWAYKELVRARNFRPAFRFGLLMGTLLAGFDQVILRGRAPWTLKHGHADHETLEPKTRHKPIDYPRPDGEVSFDKLSSVFISNTNHEENQPVHLTLKDPAVPITVNLELYDAPEQRFCPASVYEILTDDDGSNPRLQINAQNCVHCKTCDIKDPTQNIVWVAPEGGGGPNYPNM